MVPSADVLRASEGRFAWRELAGDRAPAWVRRLIAEVPLRSQVLEVGCGMGELSRELAARRGARVTAVDVCARTIEAARLRTPRTLAIEYCVADICALASEPEGFDVVVCADTLHALSFESAVSNMAGAVKRGGLLLLADVFEGATFCGWVLGLGKVRKALSATLPGVRVRRHLGRRYSAIWERP